MSSTASPSSCTAKAETETLKSYSYLIYPEIDQVPEAKWNNHLPQANVLMRTGQLKLIETTQGGSMQFRYVLVRKDDLTIGIIYFQIVRFTGNDLVNYLPEEPKGSIARFGYRVATALAVPVIKQVDLKLLVTGNIFMTGENGFYFNPEIDRQSRACLLKKAIDEVSKTDPLIRAVLISDLYAPKTDFDVGFKNSGYHEITVESDMSIQLNKNWKTFDDYIKALSSKYRVRAKKAIALCKENGVEHRELSLDEIIKYEDRIYALYNEVMERAEFKLAVLNKSFFRIQKQGNPDNYRIVGYFKDGELIGFISFYLTGARMEVHYTGMNQTVCKPIHLYQHMLYDMIATGIENGVERLHFGRTAPEIKSTVGAAPSPMYGYVKHYNKLFNLLFVGRFTANLKPKEYVIRNPFKDV